MERAFHDRAVFRAANASALIGILSGILFVIFYSTDLKPWLLLTHLLGIGAFGLGVAVLLQAPGTSARERAEAIAGMLLGIGHAAALGLLFSMAAMG